MTLRFSSSYSWYSSRSCRESSQKVDAVKLGKMALLDSSVE